MRGPRCTISDMVHRKPPFIPKYHRQEASPFAFTSSFFLPFFCYVLSSQTHLSFTIFLSHVSLLATIHAAFPSPPWDLFSSRFSLYVSFFYQFFSSSWFILCHRCKGLQSLDLNPTTAVLWIFLGSCQLIQRHHPT